MASIPNQKHEVRALINAMSKDKTIVISTHILEEVHAACNRAIIIAGGKLLADATPSELEARSRYHMAVSLTTADTAAAKEALSTLDDIESVEIDPQDNRLTAFPRKGRQILTTISDALKARGLAVSELQLESGRLDEVFRSITLPHTREARA
ncbi:MAG: transporter ATP-binding protein [Proteobacteria bacterium]|nr:transporter ATP-binding protein [Pseudomonadota bacterium]